MRLADVRYWHKADIGLCAAHVRFRGQSGHALLHCTCMLLTKADMARPETDPLPRARANCYQYVFEPRGRQ
jgi:hypothetical protein